MYTCINVVKTTDQKRSLEGRQHNSLPQSDGNKVIIKKKLPLALPAKKKKWSLFLHYNFINDPDRTPFHL